MNQTKQILSSSKRNYGIDLLRLLAVFYVALVHTFTLGGVFGSVKPLSYQDYTSRILLIIAFSCVTIFGIISGYVGYREPSEAKSYAGYFPVWLTVVFYCVINTVIYSFIFPGFETAKFLAHSFFPLTSDFYWYFSGYTFVYFLAPFLNKLLYHSSDKELKQLFFIICVFFATIEYIGGSFEMGDGYAAVWLLILYLLGGILKKTNLGSRIPTYVLFLAIILVDTAYFYLGYKYTAISVSIFTLDFTVNGLLINPFYLTASILHVMLFSRLRFSANGEKIIRFAAPAAFSVYILNTYPPFWDCALKGCFRSWASSSPIGIIGRTVLFSASFVLIVVILDYFRRKLFNLLGVHTLTKKLSHYF